MAFQQSGTGFTNLKKVVDANQDNGLGTTIQSGITNQADNTKSNLNSSFGQFQNDVNNNALDTTANRDQVTNTVNKFSGGDPSLQKIDLNNSGFNGNGFSEKASATPLSDPGVQTQSATGNTNDVSNTSAPSLSGGDVSAFEKFRAGSYNGPQQLNNLTNLQTQAQDTQQLGQSVNNTGGRQALLQRFVGGGNQYTQGQQNLDNLLLGATGTSNLKDAQQSTKGLVSQVNQTGNSAENLANQTASQNKAFSDFTNQQIANVYNPQDAQLNSSVSMDQTVEAQREAKMQALNNLLSKDNSADSGKQAIAQLADMGLVSKDPNSGRIDSSIVFPSDGLLFSGSSGWLDPKTNQYVTQKGDGRWTYDGGPQGGQQYQAPTYTNGSDQTRWGGLLDNLSKYNTSHPQSVAYNQALQQALQNTQAQNVNRAGVVNKDEALRMNALNQLAGKKQEFNLNPTINADGTSVPNIGNFTAGNQSFDQMQAWNAINKGVTPDHVVVGSGPSQGKRGGYKCWLITALSKVMELPADQPRILTQFKMGVLRKQNAEFKFYVLECEELVIRMNKANFDWQSFTWFNNGLVSLMRGGEFEAAYAFFLNTLVDLVETYWTDCQSDTFKKMKADRDAKISAAFAEVHAPVSDSDKFLDVACLEDLEPKRFVDSNSRLKKVINQVKTACLVILKKFPILN